MTSGEADQPDDWCDRILELIYAPAVGVGLHVQDRAARSGYLDRLQAEVDAGGELGADAARWARMGDDTRSVVREAVDALPDPLPGVWQ